MTYVLYKKVDRFGKKKIIKSSNDLKTLQKLKWKLYVPFMRRELFLGLMFVTFISCLLYYTELHNLFFMLLSFGLVLAVLETVFYDSIDRDAHDSTYYIKYRGR